MKKRLGYGIAVASMASARAPGRNLSNTSR